MRSGIKGARRATDSISYQAHVYIREGDSFLNYRFRVICTLLPPEGIDEEFKGATRRVATLSLERGSGGEPFFVRDSSFRTSSNNYRFSTLRSKVYQAAPT